VNENRESRRLFCLIAALLCFLPISAVAAQKAKPIDEEELGRWLNQKYDCPVEPAPYFWKVDYYDFREDGNQEAIVVASTCETGTAGPDVHSVFGRDGSGELVELKIPDVDPIEYDSLFGNRNSDLSVKDGLLVATFYDDPQRDPPLIIEYKWSGKEFAIVSVKKTGVFRTSYDCAKAVSDVENAICHVEELADLDVELGTVYKSLMAKLPAAERPPLRTEQREWLAERDKQCALYKGWVGCLADYYQKRIEELKERAGTVPPAALPKK